jgi:hypothetical protein
MVIGSEAGGGWLSDKAVCFQITENRLIIGKGIEK